MTNHVWGFERGDSLSGGGLDDGRGYAYGWGCGRGDAQGFGDFEYRTDPGYGWANDE